MSSPTRRSGSNEKLAGALAAIDRANAADPRREEIAGQCGPKELIHAKLVSQWIEYLDPNPSDALRLAARAHHIKRWTIPREQFPAGRSGYHRWRRALQRFHAEEVAVILEAHDYDSATIERVGAIIRKEELSTDSVVQTFEDALCLTFFEAQLTQFANAHQPDRVERVLTRTLAKMSPAGLRALTTMTMPAVVLAAVERALSEASASGDR